MAVSKELLIIPAFLQDRASLYVHVEQVDFLVSLEYIPFLIDPNECVFDLLAVFCAFMYADVDRQLRRLRLALETSDKFTVFN